ncbi:MAG: DUF2971 domain-containing protein [Clostridia bacterium]|nr:DUF2971 domain-containing protein [Clostridia bacterium]
MENPGMPKILFKYLPITTREQLSFRLDTLKNNHIFFPNYNQLNDPLEGSGYDVEPSGYAGISIFKNVDDEDHEIARIRRQHKILSLSGTCFSPSMWAHYTDNFHGICIGYWTDGAFSEAKKIDYISERKVSEYTNERGYVDEENIKSEVYKSFFYKHTDWIYENEYRIVQETEKIFFEYKSEDLACIILGTNLEEIICSFLVQDLPSNSRVYRAKIGYRSFKIDLYPFEESIRRDGSTIQYIQDTTTLTNKLLEQKKSLAACV